MGICVILLFLRRVCLFIACVFSCVLHAHVRTHARVDRGGAIVPWKQVQNVLTEFRAQVPEDYAFKFDIYFSDKKKKDSGVLYFSVVDGVWCFRVDLVDRRILLCDSMPPKVYCYDCTDQTLSMLNVNDYLFPTYALLADDLLMTYICRSVPLPVLFRRTSGRMCYVITCFCDRLARSDGLPHVHILTRLVDVLCYTKKIIYPMSLHVPFFLNETVLAYYDHEFRVLLKSEHYHNDQLLHTFQLTQFQRVRDQWTVKKIEIYDKNFLKNTVLDVRYASFGHRLPRDIFTCAALQNSVHLPDGIYFSRCY